MSNQMIALQAKGPKLADPAAQTAKFVNMMNMTKQQEAAERQAAQAQQAMDIEAAKEARAVQTQAATMREKDLDIEDKEMLRLYKIGAALLETEDPTAREAGYQNLLGLIEKTSPQLGATMRQVAGTFSAPVLESVMMQTEQYFNKKYPNAQATLEYAAEGQKDEQGNLIPEDTPVQVTTGMKPSTQVIRNAPNAASPAPAAAPQAPAGPVPTGKFGETLVVPEASVPLTPYQQDHIRSMQEGLGMKATGASFTPGSMGTPTAGQMTPDMVPGILDSAVNTGVMAQIDLDQMLALAPPQARQGIMDVIRSNKIALQADAPSLAASGMSQQQPMAPNPVQRPDAGFAVYRGGQPPQSRAANLGGDMPVMRNTEAQYIAVKRKDPNVGAYPGSAQVPLSRVKAEADMRRETPEQIKARKAAELQATEDFEEANKDKRLGRKRQEVFEGERAKKDAAFLDSYNDAATKGRTTLNVIDQMIGDAQLEKGKLVVPKGGRRPHPGFEGVVGMGVPGVRFIPGTQAASFDALFRQAEGGAFLQAYESLRGTGQITEIEGSKATSALTRMERSQTEVEFVKAAREFANVIRGAVARADKRYTALTGEAPPAAATRRKTLTKGSDGWGKAKVVGN